MSTLVTSNISDGSTSVGTSYVVNGSAKAWVNFNGEGTVAIRDDLNVSSLTDNGTGRYTIGFSSAMANTNYITVTGGSDEGAGPTSYVQHDQDTKTASAVQFRVLERDGSAIDTSKFETAIFGDLA